MNKEDVIKIYKVIDVEKNKGNVKFRYALIKNEGILKPEIEALVTIEKGISDILEPFTTERNDLIKAIGELNKTTNSYEIPNSNIEKINEFIEKLEPIKKKYKKTIDEHNQKFKEYTDVLKEDLETPLKLYEVKIENCPDDLATESLEILMKCKIIS